MIMGPLYLRISCGRDRLTKKRPFGRIQDVIVVLALAVTTPTRIGHGVSWTKQISSHLASNMMPEMLMKGALDKVTTSHDDLFDSFRLSLQF